MAKEHTHYLKTKKKIIITQSNYIPWKGYFDAINMVDEIILLDCVQFTKRDWRNRNQIKTPNGLHWLTVPVKVTGKYEQKIIETEISELDWPKRHWKTIKQFYCRAPFFSQYESILQDLYLSPQPQLISHVNYNFIKKICDIFQINTKIRWFNEFEIFGEKSERLLNICLQTGATDYYSGPSAKSYLDQNLFEAHGIEVHYLNFSGYPEYPQLFPPFQHTVTVLDLLLNTGPDGKRFFKSFSQLL